MPMPTSISAFGQRLGKGKLAKKSAVATHTRSDERLHCRLSPSQTPPAQGRDLPEGPGTQYSGRPV
jgi:hypothetical protein